MNKNKTQVLFYEPQPSAGCDPDIAALYGQRDSWEISRSQAFNPIIP
uniref:Uncharacterized protein n=1 Tax=Anguilla anguilla TaxID=7936 RepID=A0A0E9SVT3_ANGAN